MTVNSQWISHFEDDTPAFVDVDPDLRFPKFVYLDVVDEPDITVDLRIRAYFESAFRRYTIDSLEVRRRATWESTVDGTSMRSLRLQHYLRVGLASTILIKRSNGELASTNLTAEQVATIRAAGPSDDESLRWAARIYSIAWALYEPATKAVEETLGLSRPTVSVWLRRARDRGLLSDPDNRNAGPMDDYELIRRALEE